MTEHVSLAIVGAGPAGLEAAVTAAKAGAPVTLVDSQPQPGGQYFKQLPAAFRYEARDQVEGGSAATDEEAQMARALLEQLELGHIRLLTDTLVWGAFPTDDDQGWLLTLRGPEAPHRLQARLLILATGAYDRPIPCPGWTLPGVMTAGGLQTLLKHQHVLPGQRFVLSGTGPLQLAVAAQLVQAGADVAAVLEASPMTGGWRGLRHAAGMWGHWQRLRQGWDYLRLLRQANVAYRTGWAVVAAYGAQEVEEVVLAQLDENWFPIAGTEETISADTLVLGYGFIPATELSRLLGCRHVFEPERGGYVPQRDAQMQTSQPGVYAVGDGAGVGGVNLARIEGRIAGLAAAQQLGWLKETAARTEMARHQSELKGERRFANILGELFTPGPGLYSLPQDETIICRCEEVPYSTIREAVAAGARTVNEVKGLTRAGMGNCQGRICGELVARIIAQAGLSGSRNAYTNSISEAGIFTARPPIHPLPLSDLAETGNE